ncbi:hypothetical protein J5U23_00331 [Saccharolobus shibatae B12]|uniref:Uncharacterized protein n=2 Tax=Sulfolobaceae TaxID=118883 RepID=A0A8F5GS05_SACSH|nr:hypothetical protein [Saccharolobus shibatae]MCH4815505.1 hypothetical protein [Saccharolobus shibatae]QXJ27464.1 hypothetical protein J5U23_00331 [Saccharolobus shibatae B12]
MPKYIYCVNKDKLIPCDGGEFYYVFEFTRNNELLLSKCQNGHCEQVYEAISELGKYRFAYEIDNFDEIRDKIDDIISFLIKYNLKIYFIGDNSVLEALYTPSLFYYKYFGLKEAKDKVNFVKSWLNKLVLAKRVLDEIGIMEFKSHMDTLDGRYAMWLNTEDESASFISREGDLVKFWISYNGCDIFIQRKGKSICIKSG